MHLYQESQQPVFTLIVTITILPDFSSKKIDENFNSQLDLLVNYKHLREKENHYFSVLHNFPQYASCHILVGEGARVNWLSNHSTFAKTVKGR